VVTQPWTLRPATAGDAAFLELMLVETVNWLPDRHWSRDRVMADPNLAHYVEGWPRPTDLGVIAVDDTDQPVGAAWLRVFDATDPGYGFVGTDAPELGIAGNDGVARQGHRTRTAAGDPRAGAAHRHNNDQPECGTRQSGNAPVHLGGIPNRSQRTKFRHNDPRPAKPPERQQ